ncbi:DEAD/DEAH box helicase [Agaricicola taiwanensis]
MRALAERNYTEPTPVQRAVIEEAGADRDLLVSARTGSGKTVAFGLAIAPNLLGSAERLQAADRPLALVIAPTRELALQVQRELEWLYAQTGARVVSCVGGMDPKRERRLLNEGAHIVVGTPGRLRDHIQRGSLDVSALKAVVLDEADEMLDLGFREDLEFILQTAPESRRTLLFSATIPKAITAMAQTYQRDALRIEASGGERGHADIEYRAIRVYPREAEHVVVNLLRYHEAASAIVFCHTRDAVRHLHAILLERGFSAVALSGELSQAERSHALQALRDGHARVCVATDVAARGIDLTSLGLVIHADLPQNAEVLQHRSGRTGRAGRKGISVLLVPPARRRRAEQILAIANARPTWGAPPTAEEIRQLDQQRLLADPILGTEVGEEDAGMVEALLTQRSPAEIAAALVRLHRSRLPAPEEVSDPGEAPTRKTRDAREPRAERREGPETDRKPRRSREDFGDAVWFRLNIGRKNNADPKWLLPMICRRGKIGREDVGSIRIFDHDTRFQVATRVAEAFASAARKPDGDNIRIDLYIEGKNRRVEQAEINVEPRKAKPFKPRPSPERAKAPEISSKATDTKKKKKKKPKKVG